MANADKIPPFDLFNRLLRSLEQAIGIQVHIGCSVARNERVTLNHADAGSK